MIYVLNKDRYYLINKILNKNIDNIEVKSVINNYNPGNIFVDDINNPKTAVIYSKGIQGFYFVGDHNNLVFNKNLLNFIEKRIKKILIKDKLSLFEFSGENSKQDDVFENTFINKNLSKSEQFIYTFKKDYWKNYNFKKNLKNYKLYKINKNILNAKIINMDFLIYEINLWWGNINNFIDKSYGYIIIIDNKIVTSTIGNYLLNNTHLLEIETLKEYRRKGVSQLTCEAFIDYSLKNNIISR